MSRSTSFVNADGRSAESSLSYVRYAAREEEGAAHDEHPSVRVHGWPPYVRTRTMMMSLSADLVSWRWKIFSSIVPAESRR